jgi:uncharacterized protein (TIGR02466 family)
MARTSLTAETLALFPTRLYRSEIDAGNAGTFNADLAASCRAIAAEDQAGQDWSRAHGYKGYTSYASLDDLPRRDPAFAALARHLDRHVAAFAAGLELDLGQRRLRLDSLWINVLAPGGHHGAHIHPHSVVSGTYYVAVPNGAPALKLEDPRLPLMMAAPPRRAGAAIENRAFVEIAPRPGTVLLWESWLRHEVPTSRARTERISVSFNYAWR